jgi:hypothetical protein
MPVTFYGKWSLDVVQAGGGVFAHRFQIAGSLASDGIVPVTTGTQIAAIDGDSWEIIPEFSEDDVTWTPGDVARFPGVTPQDGLIVTLAADQFAVRFVYLNTQVNPQGPTQPPYSYTVPASQSLPQRPAPVSTRCGCRCGARAESKRRCCC